MKEDSLVNSYHLIDLPDCGFWEPDSNSCV